MNSTTRKTSLARKTALAITSLAAAGALISGCSSGDNPVDSAQNAADQAKDKAGDAADKAGDAADKAKEKAGDAADKAKGAGENGADGAAEDVEETQIQGPQGEVTVIQPIADKYQEVGGPNGHLGNPVGEQQTAPGGGYFVDFEGASIYWSPDTEAHFVQGKIKDAWMADGGVEQLGYPTSDEHEIDNGLQSEFQKAHITYIDDQTEVIMDN